MTQIVVIGFVFVVSVGVLGAGAWVGIKTGNDYGMGLMVCGALAGALSGLSLLASGFGATPSCADPSMQAVSVQQVGTSSTQKVCLTQEQAYQWSLRAPTPAK